MKYIISFLFLSLFVGCNDGPRHVEDKKSECNGCKDQKRPEPYMLTCTYKDHDGKDVPFSVEVRDSGKEPDSVYCIIGMMPNGKEKWYYSENCPKKESTGLLTFWEINGKMKQVDFTSVEISLIPVEYKLLDAASQIRKDYMAERKKKEWDCPLHGRNGRY